MRFLKEGDCSPTVDQISYEQVWLVIKKKGRKCSRCNY